MWLRQDIVSIYCTPSNCTAVAHQYLISVCLPVLTYDFCHLMKTKYNDQNSKFGPVSNYFTSSPSISVEVKDGKEYLDHRNQYVWLIGN